ncbi:ferritin-like domain-containing protein [Suttonella sp. R2A3]|uniref:ferritin-like domain-containing protein n=1 Tax=Suttonella sp. R2A3 TaxID=2908648 RepID=UPI001F3AF4F0|nr:ferritin-like domain-containing protein [Suttonella sp. R2A3]UJF25399.1 ferritin-like domain-containing protein [Suttonella sp. R2A3]
MQTSLYEAIWRTLTDNEVNRKLKDAYKLHYAYRDGLLHREATEVRSLPDAGRPAKPALVLPRDVPRRRLDTNEGVCAMLHAIAHIEFNAINLALDAAYRFQNMPDAYYHDWLLVAKEEAYHFSLIVERLEALGSYYGAFPAHDGLWQACVDTEYDVMVRMALVPRVMEARGLDVTPGIQRKLRQHGETRSADLLDVIYRDEHGHVAIGSKWFKYCCAERGLDYRETFADLLSNYLKTRIRGPFNLEARLQAGFDDLEMAMLEEISQS